MNKNLFVSETVLEKRGRRGIRWSGKAGLSAIVGLLENNQRTDEYFSLPNIKPPAEKSENGEKARHGLGGINRTSSVLYGLLWVPSNWPRLVQAPYPLGRIVV
jgi:hypothetical protein